VPDPRIWTEEQVADLVAAPWDWETFRRKHPTRTYSGFRQKRQDLQKDGVVPPLPASPVLGVKPPPSEEEVQARWASLERASATQGVLSESQAIVPWAVQSEVPVGIALLGDTHIGAQIPYDRLREDLETIRDTDGLYGIHMGDVLDNVKPQMKAATAIYSTVFDNPQEQLEYAADRLSIASGKWLCVLEGNHDAWDFAAAGIGRIGDLARHLGAAYISERGGVLDVDLGGARYKVLLKHQYTGQSRISKTNSQRRLYDDFPWLEGEVVDAVALGHTHEPEVHHTHRHGRDVLYIRSGTYKCISDGYSEKLGFKSGYGVPVLILWPGERRMLCVMDFRQGVELLRSLRGQW